MATDQATQEATQPDPSPPAAQPYVAPSPHMFHSSFTTQSMMRDVLIALVPTLAVAVYVFQWYAIVQVGLCVLSCLAAEAIFTLMRGRPMPLGDLSATVTGVILGLSLPATAPWYIAIVGSFIAVGLGKVVFGGLGYNLFNPAMVGRAFVMLSFAKQMGGSAYRSAESNLAVLTEATPLTVAKKFAADLAAGKVDAGQVPEAFSSATEIWPLLIGTVNGSGSRERMADKVCGPPVETPTPIVSTGRSLPPAAGPALDPTSGPPDRPAPRPSAADPASCDGDRRAQW